MLEFSPEATPRWRGATLPMITLALGEEKRAKPVPSRASMAITTGSGVAEDSVAAMARPPAHNIMPMVATRAAG